MFLLACSQGDRPSYRVHESREAAEHKGRVLESGTCKGSHVVVCQSVPFRCAKGHVDAHEADCLA